MFGSASAICEMEMDDRCWCVFFHFPLVRNVLLCCRRLRAGISTTIIGLNIMGPDPAEPSGRDLKRRRVDICES